MIRSWCDNGIDSRHQEDMRFDELARVAHADPAFRSVEFSISRYKGRYGIDGAVGSQGDLDRFQSLCKEHGFEWQARFVHVKDERPPTSK